MGCCGECPPKESKLFHKYCLCENTTNTIKCGGNDIFQLKEVFIEISNNLNKSDKHFETFVLNNTAIVELLNNTFNDITFRNIELNDVKNLKRIHANTFGSENIQTIESFIQTAESQLCGELYVKEFFAALSSLVNVRVIRLSNTLLTVIPSHAFQLIDRVQNNLTTIDFDYYYESRNLITSIGDYAFFNLPRLQYIFIGQQNVKNISSHAFEFNLESEELLDIVLFNSSLNDKSIENGAFANSKRPLYIDLRWNRLTFLDERIFGPILRADKRNSINVYMNPFQCDCRMHWIFKNKQLFENQIWNFLCDENKTRFWNLTEMFFDKCDEKK